MYLQSTKHAFLDLGSITELHRFSSVHRELLLKTLDISSDESSY